MRTGYFGGVTVLLVLLMSACSGSGGTSVGSNDIAEDTAIVDARDTASEVVIMPSDVNEVDAPLFPQDTLDLSELDVGDVAADAELDLHSDIWVPQDCQSHDDCDDGMCVEVSPGSGQTLCAPFCMEECPGDWVCKSIYVDGPDPVSLCFPPSETICNVCTEESQCVYAGSLCLKGSGALGFCGKYCHPDESPECPDGFECLLATDKDGEVLGYQCQPPAGHCCIAGNLKDCDDENPCTADTCDPSLGCQHDSIEGPCEGPTPCTDYYCSNGACIGITITEDLILDGIDEDCDGNTDEDWALGAKVLAPMVSATGHVMTGGGFTMRGNLSGPPVAGTSAGGDFKILPVTTKLNTNNPDQ
jgi:hypothetical protein